MLLSTIKNSKKMYKKAGEIGEKVENTGIGKKLTNKSIIKNTKKGATKLTKKLKPILKPKGDNYKGKDIKINKDFKIRKGRDK
jgi:putative cell wall-binding protein